MPSNNTSNTTKRTPAKRTSTKQTPDPQVVAEKVATATKPRASRATKAKADTKALAAEAKAKVEADVEASAPKAIDVHVEDPVERGALISRRSKAAQAEDKALKAWVKAGSKGERPATPNLDAVHADAENGGLKATAKTKKVKAEVDGRVRSQRGLEGTAARSKAKGKQVDPKPMTEEELEAWIRATLKRDPNAHMLDERPYLRFVESWKVSAARFEKAWDRVTSGESAEPARAPVKKAQASTAKPAPTANAKKAPAKQAASRKVTTPKAAVNPMKAVRKSQKEARAKVRAEAGR